MFRFYQLLPIFFYHHFWCNRTILCIHQQSLLPLWCILDCFFLALVFLHSYILMQDTIFHLSLKVSFWHYQHQLVRCSFHHFSLLFWCFWLIMFLFFFTAINSFKLFFILRNTQCTVSTETLLLRLHLLLTFLAVIFGSPTETLRNFLESLIYLLWSSIFFFFFCTYNTSSNSKRFWMI